MSRSLKPGDAIVATLLLIAQLIWGAMVLATVLYWWWSGWPGAVAVLGDGLKVAALVTAIVAGHRLRRALRGEAVRKPYAVFFASLAVVTLASLVWFQSPMHDIALAFGGHGRWGCEQSEGNRWYFVTDVTAPFLIAVPVAIATALQFWRQRRDAAGR